MDNDSSSALNEAFDALLVRGYYPTVYVQPIGFNGINNGYLYSAKTYGPWTACQHTSFGNDLSAVVRSLAMSFTEHGHDDITSAPAARMWEDAHPGSRLINVEAAALAGVVASAEEQS